MFGYWHAYSYAHVALWAEFRATFLADAFWAIFPDQKLLRRPPLLQSSTFFTWIRLAYPEFRDVLRERIREQANAMVNYDIELVHSIETGRVPISKNNPFRPQLIRLLNLQTLMEFCIPVIQDYGVAIKGNDYAYSRNLSMLLWLFLLCVMPKGVLIIGVRSIVS